jgi:hypothetical protein
MKTKTTRMKNQEAIANIKGILDSDIGKLMREDPNLSFGPAVEKAGRTFRPGMEEWLRSNAIPLGDWSKNDSEQRLVSCYWATYSHLIQRLSEIEE